MTRGTWHIERDEAGWPLRLVWSLPAGQETREDCCPRCMRPGVKVQNHAHQYERRKCWRCGWATEWRPLED